MRQSWIPWKVIKMEGGNGAADSMSAGWDGTPHGCVPSLRKNLCNEAHPGDAGDRVESRLVMKDGGLTEGGLGGP